MKTVLYVRVSTAEQTSAHQLEQAQDAGFEIEKQHVITDHGVSGVTVKLVDRDQGRRLFDLLRHGDTLVVRWVNRLGRDYKDVKRTIETFLERGVTVCTVINHMTFDPDHKLPDPTQRAARDAMLAFMAAMAEAGATAAREAREAGIRHALAQPDASTKYRGKRPSYDRAKVQTVRAMIRTKGSTVSGIAREVDLTRQTVLRIRDEPEKVEAALKRWGM